MSQPSLTGVLADVFDVDPVDLVDEAGPAAIGTWTSLRHLQLVVALEEVYGVSFSPAEIRSFKSVGDVRLVLTARGIQL